MQRDPRVMVGQDIRKAPQPLPRSLVKRKIGLLGVVLVLIVVATFFVVRHQSLVQIDTESPAAILTAVGKHYVLPAGEEPAIATVTDKSKLSSSLSKKAENGDRILIYQDSHQAIVYRPSVDKVVDVTPVQIDAPTANVSQ